MIPKSISTHTVMPLLSSSVSVLRCVRHSHQALWDHPERKYTRPSYFLSKLKWQTASFFILFPPDSNSFCFSPHSVFAPSDPLGSSGSSRAGTDHSSVLHKALARRWKRVYSRIRELLYMPQWLRNALLPHSRTGSNTSDSRLWSGAKKTALSDVEGSERVLL